MSSILTVITPAAGSDLLTLADLKLDLGITGTAGDDQLSSYIRQASIIIASRCRRTLARETVMEAFRVGCPRPSIEPAPLRLRRYPVDQVSVAVTEAGVILSSGSWELDPGAGLLWRVDAAVNRTYWPKGSITVTYSGGYLLPAEAPADLARACAIIVNQFRFATPLDPTLKAETVDGVGRQEFWVGSLPSSSAGIPAEAQSLIAPYRAFPLA
ncbi:phage head-tail connector protein [Xanthobacter autotrophicus]|uniref:phage head-tail connector protein n=1 Tax=Xanthobacter autotrophicus TaxID=280 RepID=UPI003726E1A0